MSRPADDGYLFTQKTGKLASVRFPDYRLAYRGVDSPNAKVFAEQVALFRSLLITAPPSREQAANIDYMLAAGELFTLAVYAQLVLENARLYGVDGDIVEQIFTFLVKDFSAQALRMIIGQENSPAQEEIFRQMLRKPVADDEGWRRVWEVVYGHCDRYVMNE